jgi:glycerol uptake facilitator-like aquaporin
LDSYRVHEDAVADSLTAEAEAAFQDGQQANDWSDRYVLTLVLFASVLFLTGLAQTAEATAARVGLLVLSALLFLGATYGLAVLPRL